MNRLLLATTIMVLNTQLVNALTLEESLTSGYNHNEELKIIRSDFLTEIEQFPRALAEFLPKVSAELRNTDSRVSPKQKNVFTDASRVNNSSYSRTLNLQQDLFNGGSSVAGLKAAQSAFRASKGNYYAKEQDLFLNHINVYLSCVAALEKYNISKTSVRFNKTQLEAVKEKFRLGESTETEVANAETGLALAIANEAVAYSELEAQKANFSKTFALEAVNIKMPPLPTELPETLEIFIEKATAVNPIVTSAFHNTKAAKAQEFAQKGSLLPQVSLRVQAGDAFYNPQDTNRANVNSDSITTSVSVTVPILARGGAEYSDIRRAKQQSRKSVLQLEAQKKQVIAACQSAWQALSAAKTRINATIQGVRSAEVAYEGTKQEEMLGSKTIVDVLISEEKLSQAKAARVEAEKELVLTAYRIKQLLGELGAESMRLPVDYFNPDEEFRKIKLRIVGF